MRQMMARVNMTETKRALFNFDFSVFLLLNDIIEHTLLTSVLTSRTDLKSLDIEASLDCGQKTS